MKERAFTIIFKKNSSECSSVTIPSSSCTKGICTFSFDVASSPCSNATQINVSVATAESDGSYEHDVTTGKHH